MERWSTTTSGTRSQTRTDGWKTSTPPRPRQWVTAENQLTRGTLDAIPFRAAVAERLTELWSYERWGAPVHRGDRYFYEYNDGTWDQNKLFTAPTLDAAPRPLIDPNTLSADGTVSVAAWSVSDDGRYVAYGVADAGSDWQIWRVRDVGTGADLPDELRWVKFSGASWTPDHKGFFYARFPEPVSANAMEERLANQSLWYHKVGTPQSADTLVYERLDKPDWGFDGSVTHDGKRLVLTITEGTEEKNRVYWVPLAELKLAQIGGVAGGKVRQLFDNFDATYTWIGEKGDKAFIYTDKDAPQYRLVSVDVKNPGALSPVVPEGGGTLMAISRVGGRFVAQYLDHAQSVVRVFDEQGAPVSTPSLPGVGTTGGFAGDPEDTEVFYTFSGFTMPGVGLPVRHAQRHLHPVEGPARRLRSFGLRHRAGRGPVQGRHARAHVHRAPQRRPSRPLQPHPALRLRRLQHPAHAVVLGRQPDVAGDGRRLRRRQPARRAASSAGSGTRPARSATSRTCSTTSSPRAST